MQLVALIIGKFTFLISQIFKLGAGGTWPGGVVLTLWQME